MKGHRLLFENLIDINPRTGIIKMNHRRMALMSVDALGILRRDLINALSFRRAKHFLLRYGWACGENDAKTIEKLFKWDSEKELILAGPSLHTLEGIANVDPDHLQIESHQFYFSGYWRQSFEAEEHIKHYQLHDESVCWILMGYASGYLTTVWQEEIIAYEQTCKGKGDSKCYFVAENYDENKKVHQELYKYFHTENISSEMDRDYKELLKEKKYLLKANDIQQTLFEMHVNDRKLTTITDYVAGNLCCSMIVEEKSLPEPLAVSYFNEEDSNIYNEWLKDKRETNVNDKYVTTFELKNENNNFGKLILITNYKPSTEEERSIATILPVFTVYMHYEQSIIETTSNKKEQLLNSLLEADYDEEAIKRQSSILKIDFQKDNRVIVIKTEPSNKLFEILQLIQATYPSGEAFIKKNKLLFIIDELKNQESLQYFLSSLQKNIERAFKNIKIYIGAGTTVDELFKIADSYKKGERVSEFLSIIHPFNSSYATSEQVGPIMLMLNHTNVDELVAYYKSTIGDIIEYDEKNDANFIITLKKYLDYNGNLNQTSKELHLSIPGLRYRLEKIESLTDANIKTGRGRFDLQMAIDIYLTVQVINQQNKLIGTE